MQTKQCSKNTYTFISLVMKSSHDILQSVIWWLLPKLATETVCCTNVVEQNLIQPSTDTAICPCIQGHQKPGLPPPQDDYITGSPYQSLHKFMLLEHGCLKSSSGGLQP